MDSLVSTSIGACTYLQHACGTVTMQARKKFNMDIITANSYGELLRFLLF